MAVMVIIQRKFEDKRQAAKLIPLILKLRSQATVQPGYLTGQTLRCLDCEGEYMVLSTWNRREDWDRWYTSPERRALQDQIDELLGEETRYRFYDPLVGGIMPVFKDVPPER